jgi:hypothetical protein
MFSTKSSVAGHQLSDNQENVLQHLMDRALAVEMHHLGASRQPAQHCASLALLSA